MAHRAMGFNQNLAFVEVAVLDGDARDSVDGVYAYFKEQHPCSVCMCIQPFLGVDFFQGSCLGPPSDWALQFPDTGNATRAWQIAMLGDVCCYPGACGQQDGFGNTNSRSGGLARPDDCKGRFAGRVNLMRHATAGLADSFFVYEDSAARARAFDPRLILANQAFLPQRGGCPDTCRRDDVCCINNATGERFAYGDLPALNTAICAEEDCECWLDFLISNDALGGATCARTTEGVSCTSFDGLITCTSRCFASGADAPTIHFACAKNCGTDQPFPWTVPFGCLANWFDIEVRSPLHPGGHTGSLELGARTKTHQDNITLYSCQQSYAVLVNDPTTGDLYAEFCDPVPA